MEPLEVRILAVLRQLRSNRETDTPYDNDALVALGNDEWMIKHAGRRVLAKSLEDVPDAFEEMKPKR